MIRKLLKKNISTSRIAGFILSNFIGLAIVLGGLMFYLDARSIWADDNSFIRSDYLVINKRVTSQNTIGGASSFSDEEIKELSSQPWVRSLAPFTAADYRVSASLSQGDRGMSTAMFFEAIPDRYVDVPKSQWSWSEESDVVPLIISKDYLTLYNFGFASAAGLPQLSEGLMSGIPLRITISSDSGTRSISLHGRIAGYSNRLNTILVPQNFMEWSNRAMKDSDASPSDRDSEASPAKRLIVDVNSPGDVAIKSYLDEHDYEVAGDKTGASASFLLKLVIGIILIIGLVITILSLFILMLSLSLLMEKNRDKIHSLLMLGYPLRAVERPYGSIVIVSSLIAVILALGSVFLLRSSYLAPLQGLGAETASILPVIIAALILGVIIIGLNLLAIKRKVKAAWR